jgi:hypothetical protein
MAGGFQSSAVIEASDGFSQTQVDMGIVRMQQAGVISAGREVRDEERGLNKKERVDTALYAAIVLKSRQLFSARNAYSAVSRA